MFTSRTLLEGKWPILILIAAVFLGSLWCWPAVIIAGLLLIFTISFFRDPQRVIPADPALIVAPADGKIVEVTKAHEPHVFNADRPMVAIFLSVFDVHVQRAPINGQITQVHYQPGKFHDVRHPQASAENESRTIGIRADDGFQVVVRQIAGLIARRIVAWKHDGERLTKGEHLGMIRFGSRVELFLPDDVEILVQPGQRAKGGETIVARRK